MQRLRMLVAHCKADAPIIDAFQCSECEWSYLMRQPEPDKISYADAERASQAFDGHRCEDFRRNGRAAGPPDFKSMEPPFIGRQGQAAGAKRRKKTLVPVAGQS